MRRPVCALVFLTLLLLAPLCRGLEPAADPALATVRIKSHGVSGTVIATSPGKSWVLGCAHMFLDDDFRPSEELRRKPFEIDSPAQPYAEPKRAPSRLLAWDHDLDLSLIEIDSGPLQYVPVAPPGHKPGKAIESLGFDNMLWPLTRQRVTILLSTERTTYTTERPWHGRSGGGLIDVEARVLIGVVQGYEVWPTQRGLYVSHAAVLKFLAPHWEKMPRTPAGPLPPLHRQSL